MSDWSCSSCTSWGDENELSSKCRTCKISGVKKEADSEACTSFKKAIRAYTIKDAINDGLIPKPMNLSGL